MKGNDCNDLKVALIIVIDMQGHLIPTSQQVQAFVEACQGEASLASEQIRFIDELTATYSSSYNAETISLCHELWERVAQSTQFWDTLNCILAQAINEKTTLQALILIHSRIKANWSYESEGVREQIKANMCEHAKKYHMCQINPSYRSQFRKINAIIVEILKYEWNGKWSGFLFELFQAISADSTMAENYFDLIRCVFDEIFGENDRLTSTEIKRITNMISNSFPAMSRTFKQYLTLDQYETVLKNCLEALCSLIPHLPASAVYFHFAFEEMVVLLRVPDFSMMVLSCFSELFLLQTDEGIETLKQKICKKKQSILIEIFKELRLDSAPILKAKVVEIACHVLKECSEYCVFDNFQKRKKNIEGQEEMDNKIYIASQILEISGSLHEGEFAVNTILPYAVIAKLVPAQNVSYLIHSLIRVTANPLHTQFFSLEKIFRNEEEESTKQKSHEMRGIMRSLILDEQIEEQYLVVLFGILNGRTEDVGALQLFCRACWNFYEYLSVCAHPVQNIYSLANLLCATEEGLREKISISKKMNMLVSKTLLAIRASMLLIFAHPSSLKNPHFKNIYLTFVCKSFVECANFVFFAFDTLSTTKQYLALEDLQTIHLKYTELTNMRAHRVALDQKYLGFLAQWILSKSDEHHKGSTPDSGDAGRYENNSTEGTSSYRKIRHSFAKDSDERFVVFEQVGQVLVGYRRKFNQLLNKKQKAAGYHNLKCQLLETGAKLLRVSKPVLLEIPCQVLSHHAVNDFVNLFKLFHACEQLKQLREAQQFCRLVIQTQIILLNNVLIHDEVLPDYETKYTLLELIMDNMNYQLNQLEGISSPEEQQQPLIELVVRMCSTVIRNLNIYCPHGEDQVATLTNIIVKINSMYIEIMTDNYLEFLMTIFTSKAFNSLQSIHVSKLLFQIFDLAGSNRESHLMGVHTILTAVLTNLLADVNSDIPTPLHELILSIPLHLFRILISCKFNPEYIECFCEILILALNVVRSIKWKFCQEQSTPNMEEIFLQLANVVKQQYHMVPSMTMESILNILQCILAQLNNKEQFSQNIKDLIVVLKRGYI